MLNLSCAHLIPVSLSVDRLYGHHLPPTFPHFQNNSKLKLKTWFSRLKVFKTENSMFSQFKTWSTGFLTALAACEAISCKTVKRQLKRNYRNYSNFELTSIAQVKQGA